MSNSVKQNSLYTKYYIRDLASTFADRDVPLSVSDFPKQRYEFLETVRGVSSEAQAMFDKLIYDRVVECIHESSEKLDFKTTSKGYVPNKKEDPITARNLCERVTPILKKLAPKPFDHDASDDEDDPIEHEAYNYHSDIMVGIVDDLVNNQVSELLSDVVETLPSRAMKQWKSQLLADQLIESMMEDLVKDLNQSMKP